MVAFISSGHGTETTTISYSDMGEVGTGDIDTTYEQYCFYIRATEPIYDMDLLLPLKRDPLPFPPKVIKCNKQSEKAFKPKIIKQPKKYGFSRKGRKQITGESKS